MTKLDAYESEVLEAYESGKLKPIATKAELARMRSAARATAIKDRRVNIRLSSGTPLPEPIPPQRVSVSNPLAPA